MKCQAITSRRSIYKVEFGSQCQNKASVVVHGTGLCGTHLNQAFREEIEVVTRLPLLKDEDL